MDAVRGVQFADYLVIAAIIVVVIAAGLYYARQMKSVKDFFAAGNATPWWLSGTSFFMASFSTLLFVVYNEIAYKHGLVAVSIVWAHGLMMLPAGLLLAHRWRRARVLTPVAFMEQRYNKTVHQLFVWTGFPWRTIDNALKIVALAVVIDVAFQHTGITFDWAVIILGVIMIAYTLLGGQLAIMVIDFVQATIIAVAVLAIFILTLNRFDGVGDFISKMPEGHLDWTNPTYDWTFIVFTIMLQGFMVCSASWALVQKYNTVKSEADARKMVYYITFLKLITPPIFFFPGLAARYLIPGLENTREAFAAIMLDVLPVGLVGLMLVALFSATMSTLGSEYNTLSAVLTRDFYRARINPQATERQQLIFGRTMTLLIGVLTVAIGMIVARLEGFLLMDIMVRAFSAFGPPLMVPIIVGLISRRFNARGVVFGVVAGAAFGVPMTIFNIVMVEQLKHELADGTFAKWFFVSAWNSITVAANVSAVLIGMWCGSSTKPALDEERKRGDAFFENLKTPYELDLSQAKGPSPFRFIGLTLALFGSLLLLIAFYIRFTLGDQWAFQLNFIVAAVIIGLGVCMRGFSSR